MTEILPDTEHSKAALCHADLVSHLLHVCLTIYDINEETPSGKGTTHCKTGIVIQRMSEGSVVDDKNREAISKSSGKRVEVTSKEIPSISLKKKKSVRNV